jgi:Rrf2 family protein
MAMAELARASAADAYLIGDGDQPTLSLSVIAERQHISLAYLEQIFARLRRAGLVESARGRAGGYRLARPAGAISIADIMNGVEEAVRMTRCGGADDVGCQPGEKCLTHGLWDALGAHISAFLSNVTLQQVVEGGPKALSGRAAAGPDMRALFDGGVSRP